MSTIKEQFIELFSEPAEPESYYESKNIDNLYMNEYRIQSLMLDWDYDNFVELDYFDENMNLISNFRNKINTEDFNNNSLIMIRINKIIDYIKTNNLKNSLSQQLSEKSYSKKLIKI